MKKYALTTALAVLTVFASTPSNAGYRSGGGGFRSSGSFSRSYSSPRPSYSRPSTSNRRTTVIQNHNYGGGGGSGMGGMFWGYLLGSQMGHQSAPAAPAAPSVVVVPQSGTPAPAPQVSPNQSTVAPVAPTPSPQVVAPVQPEDGGIGFWGWFLTIGTIIGGMVLVVRHNRKVAA